MIRSLLLVVALPLLAYGWTPGPIVRLTTEPNSQVSHSDSGWTTGVLDRNHIAVYDFQSQAWFAFNIYTRARSELPAGVGDGGQCQTGPEGGVLSVRRGALRELPWADPQGIPRIRFPWPW